MKYSFPLVPTACSLAALLTTPAALAATTSIQASGEPGHAAVLASFYGGHFTAVGNPSGPGFTNGAITANRVDDANDQRFDPGRYTTTAIARHAQFDQAFGYIDEAGGYQNLFDTTGSGSSVHGSRTFTLPEGANFARTGQGGTFSTAQADNLDDADHMTTYRILGLDTQEAAYVLFFEDMIGGDQDFNDLVVQLQRGPLIAAPTPLALTGGLTLLGLGILGRRRRPDLSGQ